EAEDEHARQIDEARRHVLRNLVLQERDVTRLGLYERQINAQFKSTYSLLKRARAQEARRRAGGCRRSLGRAGVRDVSALKPPWRERRSAFGKERYSALGIARGLGGASEGRSREVGLLRRAHRPVLLCRPRPGPTPMGGRRHVSADRHAAAARRRAAQLPADGVVAGSQDRRAGPVTAGRVILFCGMSIGYEDVTVGYARTGRTPLDETVTFIDG